MPGRERPQQAGGQGREQQWQMPSQQERKPLQVLAASAERTGNRVAAAAAARANDRAMSFLRMVGPPGRAGSGWRASMEVGGGGGGGGGRGGPPWKGGY